MMMSWLFVVLAVVSCLSSGLGMTPYGAGGRGSGPEGDRPESGSELDSPPTGLPQGSITSILGPATQTGSTLGSPGPIRSFSGLPSADLPTGSTGGSSAASSDSGFPTAGRSDGSTTGSFAASGDREFQSAGRPDGSTTGSFAASGDSGFQSPGRPDGSHGGSFAARDNVFPIFGGPAIQDDAFLGSSEFTRSVIQGQPTLTVTRTVTQNAFTTLTDTVFNTFAVTLTRFAVKTTARTLSQVVATPVDDYYAIRTTVIERPTFVTVTEVKSDFRLLVRTSITHVTLTHTSYAITHVPVTITATETVQITSPMVKTVISTHRQVVTDYRTIVNTVYFHGGYL